MQSHTLVLVALVICMAGLASVRDTTQQDVLAEYKDRVVSLEKELKRVSDTRSLALSNCESTNFVLYMFFMALVVLVTICAGCVFSAETEAKAAPAKKN